MHVRLQGVAAALPILATSAAVWSAAYATAPPSAPADGSYAYAIAKGGQNIGGTTVTVKHDAASIAIHEIEAFAGVSRQYVVDETLEPVDLTPTSYVSTFPLNAQLTATAHLTFDAGGARETVDGTSGATDFRLEHGTSHVVVVDGAMMTGFMFLPAQVKAQSLNAFTLMAPSAAKSLRMQVDGSSNPSRPAGVPAADTSLSIAGPASFVEWYDPQTMIVDEIDVASQAVTISRTHGK